MNTYEIYMNNVAELVALLLLIMHQILLPWKIVLKHIVSRFKVILIGGSSS